MRTYAGLAAVDIYIGATEPTVDDPLNQVYPGEFKYGGGHVIQDLVAGKAVHLEAEAYGTDCYPNKQVGGQAVLGRQSRYTTPWLTERHGYDPTLAAAM